MAEKKERVEGKEYSTQGGPSTKWERPRYTVAGDTPRARLNADGEVVHPERRQGVSGSGTTVASQWSPPQRGSDHRQAGDCE